MIEINKSVWQYLIIDLLFLSIVGAILDGVVSSMSGLVLNAVPTATISLLIMFLCVTRWNLYGLLAAPVLALGTLIGGHFSPVVYFSATYDWRVYIAIVIAMMAFGLNVIVFKKLTTKKAISNNWMLAGIMIADYLVFNILLIFVYRLLSSGNPFKMGEILLTYTDYTGETPKEAVKNLCYYIDGSFIYNLFGLGVLVVGGFILRSQGAMNNAIQKLVDDRKMAEENRVSDETFSIPDVDEEPKEESDTTDSQIK